MDAIGSVKIITADSLEKLNAEVEKLEAEVQDIIAQGWQADGPVVNDNGKFTQRMVLKNK